MADVRMAITLTQVQLASILSPHLPSGYCLEENGGYWRWANKDRNAHGANQDAINAFIDGWRDFDGYGSRAKLERIRDILRA